MKNIFILGAACALALSPLRSAEYIPGELGSLPILLGTEKVRGELGISPAQASGLDALRNSYRVDAREIGGRKLAGQADRAKAESDLAALTASTNKKALAILTPAQRADLLGIEKKFLGATLLYSPAIQKKAGVTPEQSAQIAGLRKEAESDAAKINRQFEDGKISFPQRLGKLRALRLSYGKKILGLLNPVQRDAFSQIGGCGGC